MVSLSGPEPAPKTIIATIGSLDPASDAATQHTPIRASACNWVTDAGAPQRWHPWRSCANYRMRGLLSDALAPISGIRRLDANSVTLRSSSPKGAGVLLVQT